MFKSTQNTQNTRLTQSNMSKKTTHNRIIMLTQNYLLQTNITYIFIKFYNINTKEPNVMPFKAR